MARQAGGSIASNPPQVAARIATSKFWDLRSKLLVTLVFLFFALRFMGPAGIAIVDGPGGYALQICILAICGVMAATSVIQTRDLLLALTFALVTMTSTVLVDGGWGSALNNAFGAFSLLFLVSINYTNSAIRYYCMLMSIFMVMFATAMILTGKNAGYFGIYNANTVAMVTLICIVTINCYFDKKLIKIILNVIALGLILYSESRTSLTAYIASLLFMISSAKIVNRRVYIAAFWAIIGLGLTLPYAYGHLYLNQTGTLFQTLQNFSIEQFGKNIFTGREEIWSAAIDQLGESPINFLIGIGSHFDAGAQSIGSNFHNAHFTILICTGALGTAIFFLLLYHAFRKAYGTGAALSRRACASFLALMILGIGESVLFSGYSGITVYLVLALCLSNSPDIRKSALLGSHSRSLHYNPLDSQ